MRFIIAKAPISSPIAMATEVRADESTLANLSRDHAIMPMLPAIATRELTFIDVVRDFKLSFTPSRMSLNESRKLPESFAFLDASWESPSPDPNSIPINPPDLKFLTASPIDAIILLTSITCLRKAPRPTPAKTSSNFKLFFSHAIRSENAFFAFPMALSNDPFGSKSVILNFEMLFAIFEKNVPTLFPKVSIFSDPLEKLLINSRSLFEIFEKASGIYLSRLVIASRIF